MSNRAAANRRSRAGRSASTRTVEDRQDLFDPFVSMRFSEVKKVKCVEKIVNITKAVKGFLDQFSGFIPLWVFISFFLGFILDFLTFGFRVYADPLQILVEAQDAAGTTSYFLITDRRSCFSRFFGFRAGQKMELARLESERNALLTTRTGRLGCPGWWCFCCCLCLRTNRFNLVHTDDHRIEYASHIFFECCDCKCYQCCEAYCCMPYVTTIGTLTAEYDFVQPRCSCRLDGNQIEPKETLGPNQLAVKKNKFSCKDFCMKTFDIFHDVVGVVGELTEAIAEEVDGAEGAIAEAAEEGRELRENINDATNAFFQLRERGYKKIGTTKSVWDVTFPPNSSPGQKLATVLFVIEQYWARL